MLNFVPDFYFNNFNMNLINFRTSFIDATIDKKARCSAIFAQQLFV